MTSASVRPRLEQHPGVGAVERHRPGVGRQDAVRAVGGLAATPALGGRGRRREGHRGSSVRSTSPSSIWVSTGITGADGRLLGEEHRRADGGRAISSTLTTVGGSIIASPRRRVRSTSDGPASSRLVGLGAAGRRPLARRHQRREEAGVVAARLELRGDPVRPEASRSERSTSPRADQDLGQRGLDRSSRSCRCSLPLRAADVGDHRVRRTGRQAARRTPRRPRAPRQPPARAPRPRRC